MVKQKKRPATKHTRTKRADAKPNRDRKGATMGPRPTKGDEDAERKKGRQAKAPAPPGRNPLRPNVGQALSPANSAKKDRVFKGATKKSPATLQPLDLSAFPPESITQSEIWICLACILDVFTRHMGLALKTAHLEIKRYTPTLIELYSPAPSRPFFDPKDNGPCPYCGSPAKWHARFRVYRIESGKATDPLRRALIKSLPKTGDPFVVIEQKATGQNAFFEWLDKTSGDLDFDDPGWLNVISRHYLSRKEPKVDWLPTFDAAHAIRRSRRLDSGFELDQGRLFLAPVLFDELLLVQYLASRSQKAGGLTLEGRYTLPELFSRLRNAGYLRNAEIHAHNPSDALEKLLDHLSGGETAIKFYHVVDRRELLEKAKALSLVKPPRPKAKP